MQERDRKATLKELLARFRQEDEQDDAALEKYAEAGAEALEIQDAAEPWLTLDETAEQLHTTTDDVWHLVTAQKLPAAQSAQQELRFHRRDVVLYRMRHALGGTEKQVSPTTPPVAWEEAARWGFDPYRELTPG